jgi:crossover junction endodeoxyribonuclease RusA
MILAEVSVPAPCLMMNSNNRYHRHASAKLTAQWRMAAKIAARQLEKPDLPKPVRAMAYIWKPRANHYDPGNLYPTAKAVLDGIVDAGWLPDDDFMHVEGPDMRHGGVGDPRIVFQFVTV